MSESDTIITVTNSNNYSCYACYQIKNTMVRPCINVKCNARICKECINKQVNTKNKKCGICRSPILVKNTVNIEKCCKMYTKIFYVVVMFFVGPILTYLNALGKTIVNE